MQDSECASAICVQDKSGVTYCTKECSAGNAADCSGGGCHQTNIAGLSVCGRPGSDPGTTPGTDAGTTSPPAGGDTLAPQVVINEPLAAATVGLNVTLKALVTDNVGVVKVDVIVDNVPFTSRSAGPFEFPLVLTEGNHLIKVVAYDAAGNHGEASISVTATSGAASPSTGNPSTGNPSTGRGNFGAACAAPGDCQSSLCAKDETLGRSYCTQLCSPGTSACPTQAECSASMGGVYVCAPLVSGSGSGASVQRTSEAGLSGMSCSISADVAGSAPGDLCCGLLLLGFMFIRPRRQTRSPR
jgi:hypothetical protein